MKSHGCTKKLMSQDTLANRLDVSIWTVWKLRKLGVLPPAVRIGKSLRWREEVIESWIAENERPAGEFDSSLCERSEKAARGRGVSVTVEMEKRKKRKGRPTKREQVEGANGC